MLGLQGKNGNEPEFYFVKCSLIATSPVSYCLCYAVHVARIKLVCRRECMKLGYYPITHSVDHITRSQSSYCCLYCGICAPGRDQPAPLYYFDTLIVLSVILDFKTEVSQLSLGVTSATSCCNISQVGVVCFPSP